MITTNLQLRIDAPNGDIQSFIFGNKNIEIKGISDKRHLISNNYSSIPCFGSDIKQYAATYTEDDTKRTCEVFVYYYSAHGSGKRWAVIDVIDFC